MTLAADIIIFDKDENLIYGHDLLEQIVTTRTAQNALVFRGFDSVAQVVALLDPDNWAR